MTTIMITYPATLSKGMNPAVKIVMDTAFSYSCSGKHNTIMYLHPDVFNMLKAYLKAGNDWDFIKHNVTEDQVMLRSIKIRRQG